MVLSHAICLVHGASYVEGDDVSIIANMVPGFSVSAEQVDTYIRMIYMNNLSIVYAGGKIWVRSD